MGGELGTRVSRSCSRSATRSSEIVGFDFVPPRRRLRRSEFRRIDPHDRERLTEFVHRLRARRPSPTSASTSPTRGRRPAGGGVHARRAPCTCSARGADRAARAGRGAQRPRGLRPRPRTPRGARRGRAARADHALRPDLPRGRGARGRARAAATASRWPRSGSRPCRARTCRARSAGCCGCPRCRSRRSPTRRSSSSTRRTRPGRWSRRWCAASTGPLNVVGPRRGEPVAGRAPRRPDPGPGARAGLGRRRGASPSSRARRCRRTCSSSCARAGPATAHGAVDVLLGLPGGSVDGRGRLHRAVRVGHGRRQLPSQRKRWHERRRGRRTVPGVDDRRDRASALESPLDRSRGAGSTAGSRSTRSAATRSSWTSPGSCPRSACGSRSSTPSASRASAALLVVEPRARVPRARRARRSACRLTVGRRLRIIGAPDVPVLGDLLRKLGARRLPRRRRRRAAAGRPPGGGAAGADVAAHRRGRAAARAARRHPRLPGGPGRRSCPVVRSGSRSGPGASSSVPSSRPRPTRSPATPSPPPSSPSATRDGRQRPARGAALRARADVARLAVLTRPCTEREPVTDVAVR